MGKNTPSRQEFIIENLRIELDEADGEEAPTEDKKNKTKSIEMV